MALVSCLSSWCLECRYFDWGLPASCRSTKWQTGVSDWSVGSQRKNKLHFYWLGWSEIHLDDVQWVTSTIRCLLVCQTGLNETVGGRDGCSLHPHSSLPSLHSSSYNALHYCCPCPPEWGRGLGKVVNGQPEHVIGAHPWIINVLQDKTLMETHDGIFICLQTHKETAWVQDSYNSSAFSELDLGEYNPASESSFVIPSEK